MQSGRLQSLTFVTAIGFYIYICGAIYLIGFWGTFHLDISPLIGLSDIPKLFVFPFIYTNAFFLILLYLNRRIINEVKEQDRKNQEFKRKMEEYRKKTGVDLEQLIPKPKKERSKFIKGLLYVFNIDTLTFFYAFLIVTFYSKYEYNQTYWGLIVLGLVIIVTVKLGKWIAIGVEISDFFIPPYIKYYILFFPIVSFGTGKVTSLRIYNNIEIKPLKTIANKTSQAIIDSTTFKILGILGDKAIVSTLDNKKIIILNQSAYDGLEIGEVQKKKGKSN